MPEVVMKILADQPLAKEPKDSSDFVDLNDGTGPLQVFAGEKVKTGAKDSVKEMVDGREITWVFVEAIDGDNVDKKKGFISQRFLVAEGTSVPMSAGFQPFSAAVEKTAFAETCYVQAALSKTNPAYLYALAFALSGDKWSATHVQTSDPAGVFRFSKETWQSLLSDPEAAGFRPEQIKFPSAQCVVAAIVAAKSADLLEGPITDRGLSAVDLLLAHLFADDKSFGSKAAASILQAEKDDKSQKSEAVIKARIYPDDALRTAFFQRNADIFKADGSATIEEALNACVDKLTKGFAAVSDVAKELEAKQDPSLKDCQLFDGTIPKSPRDPVKGGGDGAPGVGGGVIEAQKSATRNKSISKQLHDILEYAGRKTGIDVEIYSGGQPPTGPNRVGSHRHDVNDAGTLMGAADLHMLDARTRVVLDSNNQADRKRMADFITESANAGATGIGHAPGYMGPTSTHIGGGNPEAVWGAGNTRAGAPDWVIAAFERGRANPMAPAQLASALSALRAATPPRPNVSPPAGTAGAKRLGNKGATLVKEFESCMKAVPGGFQAYLDPVGVLTIGWGHTNDHGRRFDSNSVWTQAECDAEFLSDMAIFEKAVNDLVKVQINQDQFDALVSFAYNVGAPSLEQSTLLKKLNAGDFAGAAQEFHRWNKAGGNVLAGLTRRRASESLLFQSIPDTDFDGIPN